MLLGGSAPAWGLSHDAAGQDVTPSSRIQRSALCRDSLRTVSIRTDDYEGRKDKSPLA